ncbi:hypothetical protein A8B78_01790 [Jannaschia sp. EhC01]|nr:hypothetical protein A8B78_01790 [Jannaschia sp. EhC01]
MLRAGIIGAGRIAWSYDNGIWDGARSVSHAACLHRHPDTTLAAVFDPLPEARTAFQGGYKGPGPVALCDTLEAFFAHDLDVVAVASPSETHGEHIAACLTAGVPRLWVEKPVTTDAASFEALTRQLADCAPPPRIVVNYFRRFLPQVAEVKKRLQAALSHGTLRRVDATYSRAFVVNGVHFLDLIGYLFDALEAPAFDWVDRAGSADPSFGMTLNGVPVAVMGIPNLGYHALDLRAVTDDGRLSLIQGAAELTWEAKQPNPDYPGFFNLAPARPLLDPKTTSAAMLDGTYLSLCDLVDDSAPSRAPMEASAFTQTILARLGESAP